MLANQDPVPVILLANKVCLLHISKKSTISLVEMRSHVILYPAVLMQSVQKYGIAGQYHIVGPLKFN